MAFQHFFPTMAWPQPTTLSIDFPVLQHAADLAQIKTLRLPAYLNPQPQLNPTLPAAVVFREATAGSRSVVLASGTLAPLDTFSGEVKL